MDPGPEYGAEAPVFLPAEVTAALVLSLIHISLLTKQNAVHAIINYLLGYITFIQNSRKNYEFFNFFIKKYHSLQMRGVSQYCNASNIRIFESLSRDFCLILFPKDR